MPNQVDLGGVEVGEAALEEPGGGAPVFVRGGSDLRGEGGLAVRDGLLDFEEEGAVRTGQGATAFGEPVAEGVFANSARGGGSAEATAGRSESG